MDDYAELEELNFDILLGKTITCFIISKDKTHISISCSDGCEYVLYHEQDCCETVEIYDVCGDIEDILNSPILLAEKVSSENKPEDVNLEYEPDSSTWTFYKLSAINGSITLRWLGESSGYYSEEVSFAKKNISHE